MRTIGVLGGGQLARMLALAGARLDCRVRVLDPNPNPPAAAVAEHVCADWRDELQLARFCEGLDVATAEIESVPMGAARFVASRTRLRPNPLVLRTAQDRLAEKTLARALGIATAPFCRIDEEGGLAGTPARFALPGLLKARRGGYDGRGQVPVRDPEDLVSAWRQLGARPCLLEGLVEFDRELSQIAVRGPDGEVAFYPLVENLHRDGLLERSVAPAPDVPTGLVAEAQAIARVLLEALDHVGVLAVELFACGRRLLFNEMAPRVHNTGHWTIEGAETSQFENHLRAILGLPLGSTAAFGCSLTRNVLGEVPDLVQLLRVPGASLHLYGKQPAPRRKLGHVTVRARTLAELTEVDAWLLATLRHGDPAGGTPAAEQDELAGALA